MKTLHKFFVLLVLILLALAFPASALAAGPDTDRHPDQFVFGNSYTLDSGDTLDESLIVFGGSATIENGAIVKQDVIVMGGDLTSDGLIEGNILILGGSVDLGEAAVVNGDVATLGGSLHREPGARVEGDIVSDIPGDFNFSTYGPGVVIPSFTHDYYDGMAMNYIPPVWDGLWFVWVPFAMLTMAALAILMVMFWPKPIERIAKSIVAQPLVSGGMGCLTLIVLPFALLFMVITLVLIPVTPLVVIILGLATLLGWVAIGLELGRRIAAAFKKDWHPALAAGLGVLLITLVTVGADKVLPCFGWVIPTLIGVVALGAALLTRFGTQDYPAPGIAPAVVGTPSVVDETPVEPQTPVAE